MTTTTNRLMRSTKRSATLSRPRTKEVDRNDPRGQLGLFVRHWIDKHHGGDKSRLATALGISARAVAKWCEGEAAPDLLKLDQLAKEMGFADWSKLASAAVKYTATLPE